MADKRIDIKFDIDNSDAQKSLNDTVKSAEVVDKNLSNIEKRLDKLYKTMDKESSKLDNLFSSDKAKKSIGEIDSAMNKLVGSYKTIKTLTEDKNLQVGNFSAEKLKIINNEISKYVEKHKELKSIVASEEKALAIKGVEEGYKRLNSELDIVKSKMKELLSIEKSGQTTSGFGDLIKQYENIVQRMGRLVYSNENLFNLDELQRFESYQSKLVDYIKQYRNEILEAKKNTAQLISEQRANQEIVEAQRRAEEEKAAAIERGRQALIRSREEYNRPSQLRTSEEGEKILNSIRNEMNAVTELQSKFLRVDEIVTKISEDYDRAFKSNNISEIDKVDRKLGRLYETVNRLKERAETLRLGGANTNDLSSSIQRVEARIRSLQEDSKLKGLETSISTLQSNITTLGETYNTIFKSGDYSGLRIANEELVRLTDKARELREELANASAQGINISGIQESLSSAESQLSSLTDSVNSQLQSNLDDTVKQLEKSINSVLEIIGDGLKASFNVGKTAATTYFNFLRSGFTSVINYVKDKFSDIFTVDSGSISSIIRQFLPYAGIAGIGKLTKESIKISSSLFEIQNVVNKVFPSATDTINDFCENTASKFGLTELAAKQMIGVFGGMLGASNIVGEAQAEMSKNLTALAGDVASLYNLDVSSVYKKFQSGLAGNVSAMRSFGVSMTVANLEAYALEKGITKSYKAMSQAEKTTLRYNYMLNKLSAAQGDFANTSQSWANQTRLLSNNFKQLIGIIGNFITKALYPALVVINQITVAAINAANALANLFGFDTKSLADLFGGSGGVELPDTGSFEEGMDGVADATDKAAEAQKKYNEELQSFDRLNNMTSDDKSGQDNLDLIGSGLLNFDSYYQKVKDITTDNPFLKWLEELYDALDKHDWHKAGEIVGKAIADLVDILDNKIVKNKSNIQSSISSFMNALALMTDGVLDILEERNSFNTAGKVVGALVDDWMTAIDEFYSEYNKLDIFKKFGAQLAEFVNGIGSEVDWERAGRVLTTGFRVIMEALHGFLFGSEFSNGVDFEGWGNHLHDLLLGAIDRAFGNGGSKIIGENISGLINGALTLFIKTFKDGKVVKEFANGLVDAINTAISGVDSDKLGEGISTLLDNIGELLIKLSDIDFKGLGEKIGEGLNKSMEGGSVSKFAKGVASLFLSIVDGLMSFAKKFNWLEFASQIITGIKEAIEEDQEAAEAIGAALGAVFTLSVGVSAFKLGVSSIGNSLISALALKIAGASGGAATGAGGAGTIGGAVGSLAGSIGLGLAAIAAEAWAGKALFELKKNKVMEKYEETLKDIENIDVDPAKFHQQTTKSLKEEQDQLNSTLSSFREFMNYYNSAVQDLDKYSQFNPFDQVNKVFDEYKLLQNLYDYIQGLKELGYANDEYVIAAENAVLASNDSITALGRMQELMAAIEYLDMFELQLESNSVALVTAGKASDEYFYKIEDGVVKLKSTVYEGFNRIVEDTSKVGEEIIIGFAEGMDGKTSYLVAQSGKVYDAATGSLIELPGAFKNLAFSTIDAFATEIGSDGSIKRTSSSLDSLTRESAYSVDTIPYGVKLGEGIIEGVDNTLDSDQTTLRYLDDNLTRARDGVEPNARNNGVVLGASTIEGIDATLDSDTSTLRSLDDNFSRARDGVNPNARSNGVVLGASTIEGIDATLDSDTSTLKSLDNNINRARDGVNPNARSSGTKLGASMVDGASSKISSDNSVKSSLNSNISGAASSASSTASSGGNRIGEHIISGVRNGMSSNQGSVLSFIGDFCRNIIDKFKSLFEISSPSKVMTKLAGFIPDGVAVGIEKNSKAAYDEMGKFSDNLIDKFDTQALDMDSVIDKSKFETLFNSMYDKTDLFVEDINSKLSEIGLSDINIGDIQSKLLVTPKIQSAPMRAQLESSQNLQSQQQLSDILSQVSRTAGISNGNKRMSVNVYLDASTQLGQFVIDTMTGQVIKTGNF